MQNVIRDKKRGESNEEEIGDARKERNIKKNMKENGKGKIDDENIDIDSN